MAPGQPVLAPAGIFPHVISGTGGLLYALVLLVISLALIFAGRSVIKALAFLVAGLAGAAFGAAAGTLVLGFIGTVIGAFVGFIIGGLLGLLLVHLGIGLAFGYFGYLITKDLTHVLLLALAVGFVLFVVGLAASGKLLEVATAALGGVILYTVLVYFGAAPSYAGVISVVLALVGLATQWRSRRQREHWRSGV